MSCETHYATPVGLTTGYGSKLAVTARFGFGTPNSSRQHPTAGRRHWLAFSNMHLNAMVIGCFASPALILGETVQKWMGATPTVIQRRAPGRSAVSFR